MNFNRFYYLYVEDDPLSREVMQMIMENAMDIEHLTVFEDSLDFGQRLDKLLEKPDLILLDIHMMPINGFAMLKIIRAHPAYKDTKVIALTGFEVTRFGTASVAKTRRYYDYIGAGSQGSFGVPFVAFRIRTIAPYYVYEGGEVKEPLVTLGTRYLRPAQQYALCFTPQPPTKGEPAS